MPCLLSLPRPLAGVWRGTQQENPHPGFKCKPPLHFLFCYNPSSPGPAWLEAATTSPRLGQDHTVGWGCAATGCSRDGRTELQQKTRQEGVSRRGGGAGTGEGKTKSRDLAPHPLLLLSLPQQGGEGGN